METLVINLFGGPGVGKSSIMAHLFALLKWEGVNCEQAPEFAKSKVWEGSLSVLDNQVYVFGKQQHAINRLIGKVEVVITDSPLLLSNIYGKEQSFHFRQLVRESFFNPPSLSYLLIRQKRYQEAGRLQTEAEARELDEKIWDMLGEEGVRFTEIPANIHAAEKIKNDFMCFKEVSIF